MAANEHLVAYAEQYLDREVRFERTSICDGVPCDYMGVTRTPRLVLEEQLGPYLERTYKLRGPKGYRGPQPTVRTVRIPTGEWYREFATSTPRVSSGRGDVIHLQRLADFLHTLVPEGVSVILRSDARALLECAASKIVARVASLRPKAQAVGKAVHAECVYPSAVIEEASEFFMHNHMSALRSSSTALRSHSESSLTPRSVASIRGSYYIETISWVLLSNWISNTIHMGLTLLSSGFGTLNKLELTARALRAGFGTSHLSSLGWDDVLERGKKRGGMTGGEPASKRRSPPLPEDEAGEAA